jgi:hypothetical protein
MQFLILILWHVVYQTLSCVAHETRHDGACQPERTAIPDPLAQALSALRFVAQFAREFVERVSERMGVYGY